MSYLTLNSLDIDVCRKLLQVGTGLVWLCTAPGTARSWSLIGGFICLRQNKKQDCAIKKWTVVSICWSEMIKFIRSFPTPTQRCRCLSVFVNWTSSMCLSVTCIKTLWQFCNVSFFLACYANKIRRIMADTPWLFVTVILTSGHLVSVWTVQDIQASRDSSSCSRREMSHVRLAKMKPESCSDPLALLHFHSDAVLQEADLMLMHCLEVT